MHSGGQRDYSRSRGWGRQDQTALPHLSLHNAGVSWHLSFPPMQYLWAVGELQQRGKSIRLSVPFRFWERKCPHKAGAATRKELCNLIHSPSFALHTCWENTHTETAATLDTPHTSLLLFPYHPISFHHSLYRGSAPDWYWEVADLLCSALAQPALPLWPVSVSPSVRGLLFDHCQFDLSVLLTVVLPSHFMFFIFWITLFWVCCRTAWSAVSLSASVIPSINHSATTFTAINLLPVFQIKTHFSLPYVNTRNKHRLNVFHF